MDDRRSLPVDTFHRHQHLTAELMGRADGRLDAENKAEGELEVQSSLDLLVHFFISPPCAALKIRLGNPPKKQA